jgi:hypothetical protein
LGELATHKENVRFPALSGTGLRLVSAMLHKRKLAFQPEARLAIARLQPPLTVDHPESIPQSGPCILVMNHYARPAFHAWWIGFSISAVLPMEMHWVMTSAWTSPKGWLAWWWTPATHWILTKIADSFGFFTMPPMPPNPKDLEMRAKTVRQILSWAIAEMKKDQGSGLVLGLAPEGGDQPGGRLSLPPSGSGRFIWHISHLGVPVVPIGVFIDERGLCLSFGESYLPTAGPVIGRDQIDLSIRNELMERIAAQLPQELRGAWR